MPAEDRTPTSVVLETLLRATPTDHVTLDWLIARLGERSFGIVLLLLAIVGLLPGLSAIAAILLMVVAGQMILAHHTPVFPRLVGARRVATRRLAKLVRRIVPVLRWLERFIRPRWITPLATTRRAVGVVVVLLGAGLLVPVPLSNIPPALAILLIAFAYLEEDGVLLCTALLLALVMIATSAVVMWEAISVTGWVPSLL